MKKIILILSILLAGCANTEPKVITQTIKVPVLKTCYDGKSIPSKPELITDTLTKNQTKDVWLNGALTDVNVLKIYSETLKTFICD